MLCAILTVRAVYVNFEEFGPIPEIPEIPKKKTVGKKKRAKFQGKFSDFKIKFGKVCAFSVFFHRTRSANRVHMVKLNRYKSENFGKVVENRKTPNSPKTVFFFRGFSGFLYVKDTAYFCKISHEIFRNRTFLTEISRNFSRPRN
jgi:hypothetical protein